MGKECIPSAMAVPRLNKRSECGYFSPCKQGRGLAGNGVQALECTHKDTLNIREHGAPRTAGQGEAGFPAWRSCSAQATCRKMGPRPCFGGTAGPTQDPGRCPLRPQGGTMEDAGFHFSTGHGGVRVPPCPGGCEPFLLREFTSSLSQHIT